MGLHHLEPESEQRPWGEFVLHCLNQQCTVKTIKVNPKSRLSLQTHQQREEYWYVLGGRGYVEINGRGYEALPGSYFYVERNWPHRMGTYEEELTMLEVSLGIFDERDEVRLEDDYGRIKR